MAEKVTVKVTVHKDIDSVWTCWTKPEHIAKWNYASQDWHCPSASNDVKAGGKFSYRMEAKDGSMGFDFEGTYDLVEEKCRIEYSLDDGRKTGINFIQHKDGIIIEETFDADSSAPVDMQKSGWQSILENFKKHSESM